MELRKKALLIGLVLGDGCIVKQTKYYPKSTRHYYNFESIHSYKQKEYIEWKAELCRKLTGNKCLVRQKINKKVSYVNGKPINCLEFYRFTCSNRYFKVLYKWLYPGGKKKIGSKYLNYLTPEAIAIWYMDDGCTWIPKKGNTNAFTCEIYTHTSLEETNYIINYFKEKWNIEFHLHKKTETLYCIRCYTVNAAKFIKLIEPFVPQCMEYKVKVPRYYFHECTEPVNGL